MDDVSLSHSEIDFICNKIRGEAVAFSNYTGIFLIQQQYGKNCITDIPIFRPFEFFSLVFPELVVTSSDFFLLRCAKKHKSEKYCYFQPAMCAFYRKWKLLPFCRRHRAEGIFLEWSNFYWAKLFVKIKNVKRLFSQNIRCFMGNNMNMIIEIVWKQTRLGKGVVKNSVK